MKRAHVDVCDTTLCMARSFVGLSRHGWTVRVCVHLPFAYINVQVAEWNVKRLPLPRQERHKDRTILNDLFKHLDKFLGAKNCSLAY